MHVRRLFPAALILASGCATHTTLTECPTPEARAAAALLLASGCATHTPLTECPTPEAKAAAALLLASGCATLTIPAEAHAAVAQHGTAPAPSAEPAQVAPATPVAPATQGAPATPVAPATQAAPATPVAKKFHPDDLVCRAYEVTGSRVQQQRICKTRQQWIDDARQAREVFNMLQDKSRRKNE